MCFGQDNKFYGVTGVNTYHYTTTSLMVYISQEKKSVTSIFHVRMGKSESIKDFMKLFGVAILQLDVVSPDTVLHVVKQAIRYNTQFFDSLSLYPPITIDDLFQRGN